MKALAQVCLPIATITAKELAKTEQVLANIIEGWSKINPQTKLLLPVDQLEELITLCKTDEEREQFQKLILNAIAKYSDKIHVVITLRRVMLRMISLQGGELARRQVPKSELVYPDKEESDRVNTVIKRFSDARLIVEGSNSQGQPYVEPAHDALMLGWDKLLAWKKQEEENIILQRRLTAAAEQ